MRILLLTLLLSSFCYSAGIAQNTVTVTQKGNNNSVMINQSASGDEVNNCLDSLEAPAEENVTMVKKAGSRDTLLATKGIQYYIFSGMFNGKNKLETYQKGKENALYVVLPDTVAKVNRLSSSQEGKENSALVQFSNSASKVSITQKGKGNSFRLNPCDM